jgi:hypothetical protein
MLMSDIEGRPVFGTVGLYRAMADRLNSDSHWQEIGKPITYRIVFEYYAPSASPSCSTSMRVMSPR